MVKKKCKSNNARNAAFWLWFLSILVCLPACCHAILRRPDKIIYRIDPKQKSVSFRQRSNILVRGGQQQPGPYDDDDNNNNYNNNAGQSEPFSYATYDQNTPPNYSEDGFASIGASINEPDQLFHETVQERVDKWRTDQMEKSKAYTPQQQASLRDDQGRLKLLMTVSRGGRCFLFFVLMWRDLYFFELADQHLKGFIRMVAVVPLVALFLGNLAGVVASCTTVTHGTKKRLKAILNLDKVLEVMNIIGSIFRLAIPSKYIPREAFIAGILHSMIFLLQLQAFTKVLWADTPAMSVSQDATSTAYPAHDYSSEFNQYQQPENQYQESGYSPYETQRQYNSNQGYQTAGYNDN